jgi:hypothetical protein
MNCCDDFGNCDQGRNCPIRNAVTEQRNQQVLAVVQTQKDRYVSWISDKGLGMLICLGSSAFVSSVIALGVVVAFCS